MKPEGAFKSSIPARNLLCSPRFSTPPAPIGTLLSTLRPRRASNSLHPLVESQAFVVSFNLYFAHQASNLNSDIYTWFSTNNNKKQKSGAEWTLGAVWWIGPEQLFRIFNGTEREPYLIKELGKNYQNWENAYPVSFGPGKSLSSGYRIPLSLSTNTQPKVDSALSLVFLFCFFWFTTPWIPWQITLKMLRKDQLKKINIRLKTSCHEVPILTQFTPFCYPKRKFTLAPKRLEIFFSWMEKREEEIDWSDVWSSLSRNSSCQKKKRDNSKPVWVGA